MGRRPPCQPQHRRPRLPRPRERLLMLEIAIPVIGIAVCLWAICRVTAARYRLDAARERIARQLASPTDPLSYKEEADSDSV